MERPSYPYPCTGCGACEWVCKRGALALERNGEGFWEPVIDEGKCSRCGRCREVCAQVRGVAECRDETRAFAVVAKDRELLAKSSSGGAFTLFACDVLARRGVVFGAAFGEGGEVVMSRAESEGELEALRGSKYAQASVGSLYLDVISALHKGREVLVTATPCVCEAVRLIVRDQTMEDEWARLHLVALVCRGVGSPGMWESYVARLGREVSEIRLRDKRARDNGHQVSFRVDGEEMVLGWSECVYTRLYSREAILNRACYECQWTRTDLAFDASIGDFWGVEDVFPELAIGEGVSVVLARSSWAKEVLEKSEGFLVKECALADAMQPALMSSAKRSLARAGVFGLWQHAGVGAVARLCRGR